MGFRRIPIREVGRLAVVLTAAAAAACPDIALAQTGPTVARDGAMFAWALAAGGAATGGVLAWLAYAARRQRDRARQDAGTARAETAAANAAAREQAAVLTRAFAAEKARLEKANAELRSDVDALTQAAVDVAKAREAAAAANRAKSRFLAMMSHELRTPLNAIMGFSEIIRSESLGPVGLEDYREFAGDIYTSGAHLLVLINDLLDLAKVESGVVVLREEPVDVGALLDECVRIVAGADAWRGVAITAEPAERLPRLFADRQKLRQALLNLLANAAKFTPEGKSVAATAYAGPDGGVVLEVVDEGIGIAPDDLERALEPFVQIDSALSRAQEGAGLGLPLSKQLIELHGGALELESVVGAGTTARIRMPADRSRPAESEAA